MMNKAEIEAFIDSIIYDPMPKDQYVRTVAQKNQLVGHHTVSGNEPDNYWKMDKKRISTNFCIKRDGTLVQYFSSKYYGYNLGVGADEFSDMNLPNISLDKHTVSVELINWGPLFLRNDKWYNVYGGVVDTEVITYSGGFNGYTNFEKYTDEQIETFVELAKYCNAVYDIPLDNHFNDFDIKRNALKGMPGVYGHTHFRGDEKSDLHPQKELMEAFENLEGEWIEANWIR